MQAQLIALRENEGGGEIQGGGTGFMHRQELALVAPSSTSRVIQGCLLGRKTAPPKRESEECYAQEGKAEPGLTFLESSWLLLFAPVHGTCSAV